MERSEVARWEEFFSGRVGRSGGRGYRSRGKVWVQYLQSSSGVLTRHIGSTVAGAGAGGGGGGGRGVGVGGGAASWLRRGGRGWRGWWSRGGRR